LNLDVVNAARSWIGTKFQHQGRTRAGVDCAGLLIVVAQDLGYPVVDVRDYGRQPDPSRMGGALGEQMDRISIGKVEQGDVLWLAWKRDPQHLCIVTDLGVIHSYEAIGRVVEHPLDQRLRGRVRAAFSFRVA
jgi:cell wall-associated NlpC family hydrolase